MSDAKVEFLNAVVLDKFNTLCVTRIVLQSFPLCRWDCLQLLRLCFARFLSFLLLFLDCEIFKWYKSKGKEGTLNIVLLYEVTLSSMACVVKGSQFRLSTTPAFVFRAEAGPHLPTPLCLICYMLSCTGLMFHNECSTNSAPPFIGVCRTKHLNVWWTAALLSQTLPVVNVCNQPIAISCSCHDTDVRCSAVEPPLLLVHHPGTRCQSTRPGRFCRLISAWSQDFSFPRLLAYIAR